MQRDADTDIDTGIGTRHRIYIWIWVHIDRRIHKYQDKHANMYTCIHTTHPYIQLRLLSYTYIYINTLVHASVPL